MTSTWRKRASLLLFLLTTVALAAPAASAARAGGGHFGPQAVEDERPGEGSLRCQWLLAAACCDERPSVTAGPSAPPPPPPVWTETSRGAHPRFPGVYRSPVPTAQGRALAITVLRL